MLSRSSGEVAHRGNQHAAGREALQQYGVWCVVCGVWCMVYGVWCVVYGVWCMVYGV
jgi:hypothetical protein